MSSDPPQSRPEMSESKSKKSQPTGDNMGETVIQGTGDDLQETMIGEDVPDANDQGETVIGNSNDRTDETTGKAKTSAGSASASQKKTDKPKKAKATSLGEFKLIKKLGQGGMGEVFLATQSSLDRKVAIKVLAKQFAKKEDFVKRFYREAKSMARIDHPNVVRCYSVGQDKGLHFVAIEYIDGQSMQDWMNQLEKLSVGDALHVILCCAAALSQAHSMNLIHRDIKPDNMLVTRSGIVKVSDLGLAKAVDEDVSMTQSGTGMGTPLYMAPEQARNAKHVDHRTDIYALGASLYYFLTGQLPFTGENTMELIIAKEKGQFTSARRLNNQIPERLDLMIDKMLAKDPAHRYDSCDEIIRDIESLQLESQTLSFIDPDAAATPPRAASRGSQTTVASHTSASQPTGLANSAKDAQRQTKVAPQAAQELWFVRHKTGDRKLTISKLSTLQIQQALRGGTLDTTAKAKKSAQGTFLPLAQFPDFADLVSKQVVRAKAEHRATSLKEEFEKIDKQYGRRNLWKKLRSLTDGVFGMVSLVIYLAAIGGVCYLGYLYGPVLYKMVAAKLGVGGE